MKVLSELGFRQHEQNESYLGSLIMSLPTKDEVDMIRDLQIRDDCSTNKRLNKANLRDLIAATGLVILFKLNSNHLFFISDDLEIRWKTPNHNRVPLLGYIKFCAWFQSHEWIQSGVTIRKRLVKVKIGDFFCPVSPWNLADDIEKQ